MSRRCPKCGSRSEDGATLCSACGADLYPARKKRWWLLSIILIGLGLGMVRSSKDGGILWYMLMTQAALGFLVSFLLMRVFNENLLEHPRLLLLLSYLMAPVIALALWKARGVSTVWPVILDGIMAILTVLTVFLYASVFVLGWYDRAVLFGTFFGSGVAGILIPGALPLVLSYLSNRLTGWWLSIFMWMTSHLSQIWFVVAVALAIYATHFVLRGRREDQRIQIARSKPEEDQRPLELETVLAYAVMGIMGLREREPLVHLHQYPLEVSLSRSELEGFDGPSSYTSSTTEKPITLYITVTAEDMEIDPYRKQRFDLKPNAESQTIRFKLRPMEVGEKEVQVDFYQDLRWIQVLQSVFEVVTETDKVVAAISQMLGNRQPTVTVMPPVDFQEPRVNVSIRIRQVSSHFEVEINHIPYPIELLPHDLEPLNRQIQEAMESVASESMDEIETMARLRTLAEAGHYAYTQVFGHSLVRTAIEKLLARSLRVHIDVASESFFLPWELLYPCGLDETLSFEHFWGMKYIISRTIVQRERPGSFVSDQIPFAGKPRFGLLTYSALEHVREKEIPFFENLEAGGKIALFMLRPLDPGKRYEELEEFRAFWRNSLNVGHFACHAVYHEEFPDQSYLLLSDEFRVTLRDLEVYKIRLDGYPLIMMNACETGNLNPLYTANFAAVLLKHGARGVVATECAVPDAFAAGFAEQLYTHLLAGKPLGESLLATRRYFLESHHNPSGLLYSMYAPPSIRLVKTGG